MNYRCLASSLIHFASNALYGTPCMIEEDDNIDSLAKDFDAAMLELDVVYHFDDFAMALPSIKAWLEEDLDAAFKGDPAAKSKEEIALAYPGFYAIMVHRVAHLLYQNNVPILPRVMSELAHSETGIDIHPGATIGHRIFIDHGTGVVIGETAEVGDDVRIYQGVTIGAKSLDNADALRGKKRHPTIKNNVIIYAGASILGGDTVIGNNVIIGSNVFITFSVEDNKIVRFEAKNYSILDKQ